MIQQYLLLDKVVKIVYFLPHFSNFLVFRTESLVSEKSNISNNFKQELVRSCKFRITKRRSIGAAASTNFCLRIDNF